VGLLKPTSGRYLPTGSPWHPSAVGIVFQNFALFPWLTVRQNVEVALNRLDLDLSLPPSGWCAASTSWDSKPRRSYPKELSGG
jgi:NitT/TauT family transport system ATP-binding protein